MKEYISVQAIAVELGKEQDKGNFIATVRRTFPQLVQKRRLSSKGQAVWAIPVSEKELVLRELNYLIKDTPTFVNEPRVKKDWERECAKELEQQGYITIVTKEKGTPDVVAFRKRPSGGFDLVFREAKGPTDSVHKEQLEFRDRMQSLGIDADFRWFE